MKPELIMYLANYLVLTRAGCAEGTLSLFKVLSGVSYVVLAQTFC